MLCKRFFRWSGSERFVVIWGFLDIPGASLGLGRSRNFHGCIGNVAPTRREEMFRFDAEVEVFLDIDEETDDEVPNSYFEAGEHGFLDIFEHGWS